MTDDIHSCSYYCDLPQCIKQQRDELREQLERVTAERDELRRRISEGVVLRRGILVDKTEKDDDL